MIQHYQAQINSRHHTWPTITHSQHSWSNASPSQHAFLPPQPISQEQATPFLQIFNTVTLKDLTQADWYIDMRVTAHLYADSCIPNSFSNNDFPIYGTSW